ncbi:MAG: hypothetical protein FVQ79_12395 [Planctomycetes bacterium]|nr:hypothetical protein [Planctomycetota bacterium]
MQLKTLSKIVKRKLAWLIIAFVVVGFMTYKCREPLGVLFIKPKLSSLQAVKMMEEQGGLLNDSPKELLRAVRWYVFRGDVEVIKQLVRNIENEQEIVLPEDRGGRGFSSTVDVRGRSGWILHNQRGIYRKLGYVLHQELWRYAQIETSPHQIYLLMRYVGDNTPMLDDMDHGPISKWYDSDARDQDAMAYLRIYSTFNEWPSIRRAARGGVSSSGVKWCIHPDKLFKICDEQGPEAAYKVYLDNRSY